jgi:hypothetical protein
VCISIDHYLAEVDDSLVRPMGLFSFYYHSRIYTTRTFNIVINIEKFLTFIYLLTILIMFIDTYPHSEAV